MMEKSEDDGGPGGNKNENPLPRSYSPKQVEDGVKVLFQILEKTSKKSLFENEGEYIRIQISFIRIGKNRKKHYRFHLPHGILKETSEICLFVRNLSKSDREYENTVRHFKNLLAESGVTCISEVISVRQLMEEYKTYEMRRRLASRFDMFLADDVVNKHLHGALGKAFHRCRKQPNPVDLGRKNLKILIDKTILKTTLTITGTGAQVETKIGHTKQSVEQVCQNIEAFVKELQYIIPGKWRNVRALHIRTDDSMAVPIYYSFAHPNSVKVPKPPKQQPYSRRMIPVEIDEISTLPDGYEVMTLPTGEVKVKGKKSDGTVGWLSDLEIRQLEDFDPLTDDEEEEVENDEGSEGLTIDSGEKKRNEHVKQEKEDYYSDSEEDEAGVEAAEDAYLKELTAEMVKKDKKRKLEKSDSFTAVKKSKNITKEKNNICTNWKVEMISYNNESIAHNVKNVKKGNNSWKVEEATPVTEAKKTFTSSEASVRTKGEIVITQSGKAKSKAKDMVSEFGTKGKVSGNKLGKKKKSKHELKK